MRLSGLKATSWQGTAQLTSWRGHAKRPLGSTDLHEGGVRGGGGKHRSQHGWERTGWLQQLPDGGGQAQAASTQCTRSFCNFCSSGSSCGGGGGDGSKDALPESTFCPTQPQSPEYGGAVLGGRGSPVAVTGKSYGPHLAAVRLEHLRRLAGQLLRAGLRGGRGMARVNLLSPAAIQLAPLQTP